MNVVVLAAGLGKRMHSDLPKVLHPLAGKSLLAHVVATARSLKPGVICIVYGHGGESGRAHHLTRATGHDPRLEAPGEKDMRTRRCAA